MDIQATCGCGAKVALTPGSPSMLGNGHGYASNNTETVNAEREAVATAFAQWVSAHQQCRDAIDKLQTAAYAEGRKDEAASRLETEAHARRTD